MPLLITCRCLSRSIISHYSVVKIGCVTNMQGAEAKYGIIFKTFFFSPIFGEKKRDKSDLLFKYFVNQNSAQDK